MRLPREFRLDGSSARLWLPLFGDILDHSGDRGHPTQFDNCGTGISTEMCLDTDPTGLRRVHGFPAWSGRTRYVLRCPAGLPDPVTWLQSATVADRVFTVTTWAFIETGASGGIVSQARPNSGDDNYNGWEIGWNDSTSRLEVAIANDFTGGQRTYQTFVAPTKRWVHIAAIFDRTNGADGVVVTVFLDGRRATAASSSSSWSGPFVMANDHRVVLSGTIKTPTFDNQRDYRVLSGATGPTRIYRRALGGSEIRAIFVRERALGLPRQSHEYGRSSNTNLPLVITGHLVATGSLPLFASGAYVAQTSMNLMTAGRSDVVSGSLPLMVFGATGSAMMGGLDLVVGGSPSTGQQSLNLSISGPSLVSQNEDLNLSLFGAYPVVGGTLPLVLDGGADPASGTLPIVLKGATSAITSATMNLFIARNEAAMLPFILAGAGTPVTGSLPLVTTGHTPTTGSLPLAMPSVTKVETSGLKLYTHGA